MASVRKRKWVHGGVAAEAWIVAYKDQSGKRRQETFEKKKDADKRRLLIETEIEGGSHVPDRDSVDVRKASEAFMRECDRRRHIGDQMAGYTHVSYRVWSRVIAERFGGVLLTKLSRPLVQAWFDELSLKYKRKTLSYIRTVFRQTLLFAIRQGWLQRHVLLDDPIRLPASKGERIRVPTRVQLQQLLRAMSDRVENDRFPRRNLNSSAIALLGICAGLRRGEIAGLQWEDVDFAHGVIHVRHSLSSLDGLKAPKTSAGVRDVPMAPVLQDALLRIADYWALRRAIYDGRRPTTTVNSARTMLHVRWKRGSAIAVNLDALTGPVLRAARSSVTLDAPLHEEWSVGQSLSPSSIGAHHWREIMTRAGLLDEKGKPLFSMHAMRHAFASLLIERDLSPMLLKTAMGHSKISTTYDVYGHLLGKDDRTGVAISDFSRALTAATEQQQLTSI